MHTTHTHSNKHKLHIMLPKIISSLTELLGGQNFPNILVSQNNVCSEHSDYNSCTKEYFYKLILKDKVML